MPEIRIAPARDDDVRAILRRNAFADDDIEIALARAREATVWAALDEGAVVGIAIGTATDDERLVNALFVEPSYRKQGIGARLLDAGLGEPGDAALGMYLDPNDAACLRLAIRRAIVPQLTVVGFSGAIPRDATLFAMAAGEYRFEIDALDPPRHALGIARLDREAGSSFGFDDHARFVEVATAHAIFINGELVAYVYAWPDGRIGPIATASGAYSEQIFAFALATLQRKYAASWCTLLVPTTNVRVARAALRAGLQVTDAFAIGSNRPLRDTSTYVGYRRLHF